MMAYFWDSSKGYLYFKMTSNETFNKLDQVYPADSKIEVKIVRLDGDDNPETCINDNPEYVNALGPSLEVVTEQPCAGVGSPKGLGAPVRVHDFDHPQRADTCADCPLPDVFTKPRAVERRGCFWQEFYLKDLADDQVDYVYLKRAMTPDFCVSRCYQRGFPYAGVYSGTNCQCANSVGRNGVVPEDENCLRECSGNTAQLCGGGWEEVYFYTTGAGLTEAPTRCGPQSRGVVHQDHCVYVNYVVEEFWSAEARCASQGGTLATIQDDEKMRLVEAYLMDVDTDVWFGAKGTIDNWYNMDETVMTWFNWRIDPIPPEENRFLYLQEYRRWKWNMSPYYRTKRSLCDLPIETSDEHLGNCGYNKKGTLAGSNGRCFHRMAPMLNYHDAKLECTKIFGRIASVLDQEEKEDIETYLDSNDDSQRYWVEGDPNQEGYQKAYNEAVPRSLIELDETRVYPALCLLDSHDTLGCPTDWTKNGDSCYLDMGRTTTNYFDAAALCNGERSSLLTVDTSDEGIFIQSFITGTAWTDLRYDGILDDIVTSGGVSGSMDLWSSSNPLLTLSNGLCVVVNADAASYQHEPCRDTTDHHVICEAPLTFFDSETDSECGSQ